MEEFGVEGLNCNGRRMLMKMNNEKFIDENEEQFLFSLMPAVHINVKIVFVGH